MSGGGWKEPFYDKAERDSDWIGDFANKIGWQGLEDEANTNEKNPGRAIGKAAGYAAAYLAGMYGAEQLAPAAEAAVPATEAAVGTIGTQATGTVAANLAEQQAAQQAMQQMAQQGLLSQAPAPVTQLSANTVPVTDLSSQAGLLDKARLALTSGSGTGKGGLLAQQLGMQMIKPQQEQPMPQSPPPRQGNMEPLPKPYNQGPYGTSAGNSMGLLPMDEETKRKLRAMGVRV